MNTVIINGRVIQSTGNLSINGNKVYSDGKLITDCNDFKEKVIHITVNGNIEGNLSSDNADITVNGNVNSVIGKNGNITISGDVTGNVENKNGNIKCGNIAGSVDNKNGNVANKSNNIFQKIFMS